MRSWLIIMFCALAAWPARADVEVLWKWFSPELRELNRQQKEVARQLEQLGTPVLGPTAIQFGYQHDRSTRKMTEAFAWIQIDLNKVRPIDAIALIPAQVDWQAPGRPAYGFPSRFRVELCNESIPKGWKLTDPVFRKGTVVADYTKEDYPSPGAAPLTVHCGGRKARYVRLIVTKMAFEDGFYFYALSEIMVLSGNLNVAIGSQVRASKSYEMTARWALNNLVDGRTPFGPPIQKQLKPEDGLYSGLYGKSTNLFPWMQLDLGRPYPVEEVRLHPVHAWLGADIPGFAFPPSFKVEAGLTPDLSDAHTLMCVTNYPNPGNNPVTIPAEREARYIKITSLATNTLGQWRFGLSEVEVYSGNRNVARSNAVVTHVRVNVGRDKDWPATLLVDGYTSFGQLQELPEWLAGWERRNDLQSEARRLAQWETGLAAQAQRRAVWSAAGVGGVGLAVGCAFVIMGRIKQRRDMERLRLRLTRDIHDEIGSNLAGIAMLSEVAADSGPDDGHRRDWNEVNQIAQETMNAMREVLWLVDVREETSLDLMKHLQLAASRMLVGKEVYWKSFVTDLPATWPAEARRQVFLIFKESLTNVIRHAHAHRVELSAQVRAGRFQLSIADDGCGFDLEKVRPGIGSTSMQIRARSLGGTVKIHSLPGQGTTVLLDVPLAQNSRLSLWGGRMRNLFQKDHARSLAYRG